MKVFDKIKKSIVTFILDLKKAYYLCKNQPALKIIDTDIIDLKNASLKIQCTGKNIFTAMGVNEISENPSVLEQFDELDKDKILEIAYRQKGILTKRIANKTFDRTTKEFIFAIEHMNQIGYDHEYLTSEEILKKYSVKEFCSQDAFEIGLNLR